MMNRKNLKALITTTLASVMILGAASIPTLADELNGDSHISVIETKKEETIKYSTFEQFMKNDIKKKNISEEDRSTLEMLYNKVIALKKESKMDAAKKVMSEFYEITKKYEDLYKGSPIVSIDGKTQPIQKIEYSSFESFMKNDIKKKDISSEDLANLKVLYTKAIALIKEGKMTDSDKVMADFYEITNKYEDLYKSSPVAPVDKEYKPIAEFKFKSFEMFMKEDIKKKDVSDEDLALAKTSYEKYIALQKEGKFQASQQEMDRIFEITSKYEDLYKNTYVKPFDQSKEEKKDDFKPVVESKFLTFDEFMKYDVKKKGISDEDLSKLKELYEESITLKEKGNYSHANKIMDTIFEIASKYEDN